MTIRILYTLTLFLTMELIQPMPIEEVRHCHYGYDYLNLVYVKLE